MVNPLLSDPWIAARIDEALAPYVGRLPASEVAWMREQLVETLSNDEHAASLLRAAVPRHVDQSGEVAKDGSAVHDGPTDPRSRSVEQAAPAKKKAR